MTDEMISELSLYEQNLSHLVSQKQHFQSQILEVESALSELDNSKEFYKIIGSIMVKKDKDSIKEELDEKHKLLSIRIESIESQENVIRDKSKKLRDKLISNMAEGEEK